MRQNSIVARLDSDVDKTANSVLFGTEGLGNLTSETKKFGSISVPVIVGEFWTSGQRQAASIHEVSYRACFKPQLPGYFIKRFSNPGQVIYDPFSGRGTTAIEAALCGRRAIANDVNPLSEILARPRIAIPEISDVLERLSTLALDRSERASIDLSMFYDAQTEKEIVSLRNYLNQRRAAEAEDDVDRWIRMVATNRLTGHSPGFFSVYTFPPNQAVSAERQIKINQQRNQRPPYRDIKVIISKKTRQLLGGLSAAEKESLRRASSSAIFLTADARQTGEIKSGSVQLVVTSPPFLDVVQYADDNWLRCWFNGLSLDDISAKITMAKTVEKWSLVMRGVFQELFRVVRPQGVVAFEVGEVRNGKIRLEEYIVPLGAEVGFTCEAVLINEQSFTKTANLWGVTNNKAGTNSNRIVLFRKV